MTRLLLLSTSILLASAALGQDFVNVMEDSMYDTGRINVVLGVVLIIFVIIFLYLLRLDKKIGALEKELES